MSVAVCAQGTTINPILLAQSRLRRRRFDDAIHICTDCLRQNALDQQAWFIKVRATTLKNWVDDTELEEEGVTTVRTDPRNILHVLANNQ
jgi:tetratricopeptide repeat protein 8